MPVVPFIPAIIGGVSSVAGGLLNRSAAGNAANAQQAAADAAGAEVRQAAADVNPNILRAAAESGANATAAAGAAGAGLYSAADRANNLLDPYREGGNEAQQTLRTGLQAGGDFNKTPGLADLEMDPGYAFRAAEGQKAINASAAAHGGALSGGVLKALEKYRQGVASQEYQNAFNRFQTSTQNRYNNLFQVAGRGQQAASEEGQNLGAAAKYSGDVMNRATEFQGQGNMNAANLTSANTINAAGQSAEYRTQAANAQAAGIVGRANALTGAISGVANAGIDAAQTYGRLHGTAQPALMNPAAQYQYKVAIPPVNVFSGTTNPRRGF